MRTTWLARVDLLPVAARLPAYVKLGWGLARDRRLTAGQRALLVGGIGYLMSPIDLIPGFLPVIGQIDDLTVVLWAIRRVLRGLPEPVRDEHLERTGLTMAHLDGDLRRLRRATGLIATATLALGGRVVAGAGGLLWRGMRSLLRAL